MSADLDSHQLRAVHDFAIVLSRKAGDLILEGSRAIRAAPASAVDEKKNSVDLVTEYDVRVEELVKAEVARAYPHFGLCVTHSVRASVWG
jgi:myo-inositol-1(or 4)-monophosphatase